VHVQTSTPHGHAWMLLDVELLRDVFTGGGSLGHSGRSFLLDPASRMVTGKPTLLARVPVGTPIDSHPIGRCLRGEAGEVLADNFEGTPSVHAFRPLSPPGACVMVQIDQAEVFAPAVRLQRRIALVVPILLLVSVAISTWLARRLARPVLQLAATARRVHAGDLSPPGLKPSGPREFQELCRTFSAMVEALAESARLRDRFLGVLGHDLRNPLSAIHMSAQTVARACGGQGPMGQASTLIVRSAERMTRMVRQLLDFARIREARDLPLAVSGVDLGRVVTAAVDELRAAHPDRQVTVHLDGDLTGVWDADRLSQVVSNLVGNAFQHGGPGPEPVEVRVEDRAHAVHLSVHNGGAPIPPERRDAIFEPYRQGIDERGTGASVGLGLFVVDQIVRAHGGKVTVRSSEREGTTFAIALPRQTGTRSHPPAHVG
jgi:signal transduction histidine kinase